MRVGYTNVIDGKSTFMPSRRVNQLEAALGSRVPISRHATVSLALLLSLIAFSGCGGAANGARSVPTTVTQASSLPVVPVHLTYFLPSLQRANFSSRNLQYISASNTKITISVTPVGAATPTYGPTTTGCTP